MKRITIFISLVLLLFTSVQAFGQAAKKPRIMIIPSDALLLKMGLLEGTDDLGQLNFYQHYNLAFLNDEVKAVVAKFGELMKDRGFPMTSLEMELKKVQNNEEYVIPRDIDVMLNYELKEVGPRQCLYVTFEGIEVCSSKQIAGASGESAPAIGAMPQSLLAEAVIDKIDKFNDQLMSTFQEMAEKGREASIHIISQSQAIDDDFGSTTLEDLITQWLDRNCVRGAYSVDNVDEHNFQASQVMMPLFDENGKALDGRKFFTPLRKYLKDCGLNAKLRNEGIGKVTITIE